MTTSNIINKNHLNAIVKSIIENKFSFIDNFFSSDFAEILHHRFIDLTTKKMWLETSVGDSRKREHRPEIRSDKSYWLDEENIIDQKLQNELMLFGKELSRELFLSIDELEAHFAFYNKGAFYSKHLDSTIFKNKRLITMTYYSNKDWKQGDGGELQIYPPNEIVKISPLFNRAVIFLSEEIPHEVLVSNTTRYSLAVWFRKSSVIQ